jgi:hypothetical protein
VHGLAQQFKSNLLRLVPSEQRKPMGSMNHHIFVFQSEIISTKKIRTKHGNTVSHVLQRQLAHQAPLCAQALADL